MHGTLGPVTIEPASRGLFIVQQVSDVAHSAQQDNKDAALPQKRERQAC